MDKDSPDDTAVEVIKINRSKQPDWKQIFSSAAVNAILFKTFTGKPMRFHFKIYDDSLRKKYEDITVLFGGVVSEEFDDVDYKTAVMVEDYGKFGFINRTVYRVSYITDCVTKDTLFNIEDYEYSKYSTGNDHFMDVFFWEKKIFQIKTLERYDGSSDSSDQIEMAITIKKKQSRDPYSRSEQEDILRYIVSHSRLNGLRGSSIWKTMEKKKICPKHTHQSMKNHFLKKLLPSLDRYEFLSESQKKMMRKLDG